MSAATQMASVSTLPVDDAPREQMNIVIVGHVDHGKSTLVGRLLADSDSLPDGKLEQVRGICDRQGKVFEYAFLLDALEEEQDQGITIDSARVFFKTDKRDVIIIDAPGHIEFLKNMISGAARAEAAVLLIDAHEGVQENSRRHGYLLGMLGISQVTVAVNKMDLVDYDQQVFDRIEAEYRAFLGSCGVVPQRFVPISAREGDNIAKPGDQMSWYRGPTILEAVGLFEKAAAQEDLPLRLPVQDIYKFNARGDDRRIIAGRIESGTFAVGDKVVFSPSNKTSTVKSIEAFSAPESTEASAPRCVGLTLTEQIFIDRGEVMSHVDTQPRVSTLLRANLFWLGRKPMERDRWYKLKLATRSVKVRIHELIEVVDASALEAAQDKNLIDRHDVGEVILETQKPVAFDLTQEFEATGRFVIVDEYDVAGGGIILDSVQDAYERAREEARLRDFEWVRGEVTRETRKTRFGHRPALVLFTGDAGVGKALIARELERVLFEGGCTSYLLDARNVFLGVERDVADNMDRAELVRRYAEVAHLFMDSGHIVVSTSNTFGLGDHRLIHTLVGEGSAVLTVHVGGDPDEAADLVLPAGAVPEEAVIAIGELLRDRNILLGL
ncbi:MAG: GTP-binding protein [Myxococcota bacterium]|nr:GTP-binding protein [Myxococcota bacterium]